jgi:hypothetical protein
MLLCGNLFPVCLYHIFSHYLIKCNIFGKKIIEYEMCVLIFKQILSEIFLFMRKFQLDFIRNLRKPLCKKNSHLKEEALEMWRARFGRSFGPVVRQTINEMHLCKMPLTSVRF